MNVVKRADFLVSGVFPGEDRAERVVTKALVRLDAHGGDGLSSRRPQSIRINGRQREKQETLANSAEPGFDLTGSNW